MTERMLASSNLGYLSRHLKSRRMPLQSACVVLQRATPARPQHVFPPPTKQDANDRSAHGVDLQPPPDTIQTPFTHHCSILQVLGQHALTTCKFRHTDVELAHVRLRSGLWDRSPWTCRRSRWPEASGRRAHGRSYDMIFQGCRRCQKYKSGLSLLFSKLNIAVLPCV